THQLSGQLREYALTCQRQEPAQVTSGATGEHQPGGLLRLMGDECSPFHASWGNTWRTRATLPSLEYCGGSLDPADPESGYSGGHRTAGTQRLTVRGSSYPESR